MAFTNEPFEPQKTADDHMDSGEAGRQTKHFWVSRVIQPALPTDPIESLEIGAVISKATKVISWRELQDEGVWRQGWI